LGVSSFCAVVTGDNGIAGNFAAKRKIRQKLKNGPKMKVLFSIQNLLMGGGWYLSMGHASKMLHFENWTLLKTFSSKTLAMPPRRNYNEVPSFLANSTPFNSPKRGKGGGRSSHLIYPRQIRPCLITQQATTFSHCTLNKQ